MTSTTPKSVSQPLKRTSSQASKGSSPLNANLDMCSLYVVEDHDRLRSLIVKFLSGVEGFRVIGQAASAEAALTDPIQAEADIVLTDLSLPGMRGTELTRRLLAAQPERVVILLTAHSEDYYKDKAFKAGASAYVVKGDPQKLEGVIKRVLAGERRIQE